MHFTPKRKDEVAVTTQAMSSMIINNVKEDRLLQIALLLADLIAVPWMIFPKPFILRKRHAERFQVRTYGILRSSKMDTDSETGFARHHENSCLDQQLDDLKKFFDY
uniref:V-type proton ATPase subunit a1 n=1 Tax=Tanacetum cinerariifolium TaxID=118510 RepID=A0A6L2LXX4_TANCI|nr:V-type proton ATPase subunit a1 [Tanacetum cinerariifolium]